MEGSGICSPLNLSFRKLVTELFLSIVSIIRDMAFHIQCVTLWHLWALHILPFFEQSRNSVIPQLTRYLTLLEKIVMWELRRSKSIFRPAISKIQKRSKSFFQSFVRFTNNCHQFNPFNFCLSGYKDRFFQWWWW